MAQLTIPQLEKKANEIRIDIIKMVAGAGSGHCAGPLDQAEIFTALYFSVMRHNPENPDWEERDILIESNGHCVPVRYAAMAHAGYFPKEELMTLRKFGSRLQGHPERTKLPGLETTSGPLGSGLSQAAGVAMALKIDDNHTRWVYCTVGDGELDEGNNWEAIMFAAKNNLHNLIVVVDRNNIQIDGNTENVMPLEPFADKWRAFGWHVQEVDGHNIESVIDAFTMARAVVEQPSVIVAHTIPGKGVPFMEYDYHWHGGAPNSTQAKEALQKLRSLNGTVSGDHN